MNSHTLESLEALNTYTKELVSQATDNKVVPSVGSISSQSPSDSLLLYLSSSILVFIVIAFMLCTLLLWKREADAYDILKVFGILSIVGLSALILVLGFSNEQLTPIIGLFGAIAGYLLGKESSLDRRHQNEDA